MYIFSLTCPSHSRERLKIDSENDITPLRYDRFGRTETATAALVRRISTVERLRLIPRASAIGLFAAPGTHVDSSRDRSIRYGGHLWGLSLQLLGIARASKSALLPCGFTLSCYFNFLNRNLRWDYKLHYYAKNKSPKVFLFLRYRVTLANGEHPVMEMGVYHNIIITSS